MAFTKEQEYAVNCTGSNVIVSAGAGSGKTSVLTARVIRKLKEGTPIDKMLIITFTNAAAKEMKTRIKNAIKDIPSLKHNLEIIDAAYILTFDSFAMSTVKKYHYLLNLSPNLDIIDEAFLKIEKKKIIDEIFENKYKEKDADFLKLIYDFCTKDDKNIKDIVLKIDSKLDLKLEKEKYLESYLDNYFNCEKLELDKKRYLNLINEKKNFIKDLLDNMVYYVDGNYFTKLEDAFKPLLSATTYKETLDNIEVSIPRRPNGSSSESKIIKDEIDNVLKELKSLLKFQNIDEIDESIKSTYSYQKALIEILTELNQKVEDFKFQNDLYEFQDIAKLLIKLLRDNPDILAEMKDYFDEIMVDEYQDTNDLQETFISYLENNNVYMVGDIKQSIYRFRNANPDIFKNKYLKYQNNNGGIKIDLNANFRSRREVLLNINDIFNDVMDLKYGGADYTKSHQMTFGNEDYINKGNLNQNQNMEILNYNYNKDIGLKNDEVEAFIIAQNIKEKIENGYMVYDKDKGIKRKATYADFAILVDKSTSFELYKKIFEYQDIPLTIYKDSNIKEDIVVILLKNVLKFVKKIYMHEYDEEFKYLFMSLSRSPLARTSDAEIFNIIKNNNIKSTDLYKRGYELSKEFDSCSLHDFVSKIIDEFNFIDALIKYGEFKSSQIKLDYLKKGLVTFENMGYTLIDYLEYLDNITEDEYEIRLSENKEATDGVKMMTIHGSKGLEFHVCFYPGLYSKFNLSDLNDAILYDENEGIITKYLNQDMETTIYKDLFLNNYYKEEISEKIRLFYVSLTRAKEKMIFLVDSINNQDIKISDYVKNKYRSFKDILLSVKLDKYIYDVDLSKIKMSKNYNFVKNDNYESFIKPTNNIIKVSEYKSDAKYVEHEKYSKEANKLFDSKTKENIKFGLKMHQMLEITDFINPDYYKMDSFTKEKIMNFLASDLLKNIKESKIYKEYEFTYQSDNSNYHGIIDLMLVYDDHIDIIDYKLKNISDEAYIKQLNGYKDYIHAKFKKKTNTYLYSIMDNVFEMI